jgi:hypothetical protein
MMPVPTTKQLLLDQVQQERELWEGLLAEIGPEPLIRAWLNKQQAQD